MNNTGFFILQAYNGAQEVAACPGLFIGGIAYVECVASYIDYASVLSRFLLYTLTH